MTFRGLLDVMTDTMNAVLLMYGRRFILRFSYESAAVWGTGMTALNAIFLLNSK